jgi:hypothetical protein
VVIRVLAVSVGMRFAYNKRELRGFLQEILFASHVIISQYHTVRKEMLDLINIIGIEITCSAEHFHRGGYPDGRSACPRNDYYLCSTLLCLYIRHIRFLNIYFKAVSSDKSSP